MKLGRFAWCLLPLLTLLAALPASGQVEVLLGGDGVTTSAPGSPACGTDPGFLNSLDAERYETWSASEFAATNLELRGAVPSPLGKDSPVEKSPLLGVILVNPGLEPVSVSEVRIEASDVIFNNAVLGVRPTTGWNGAGNTTITWTGLLNVPPQSAFDFMARVRPRAGDLTNVPLTLSAVTSRGSLANGDFATSTSADNDTPGVSLTWVEGTEETWAGVMANEGSVVSGEVKTFRVRVREEEQGANQPIPVGSTLTITIPPGWSEVTPLPSPDFDVPAISPPETCASGTMTVSTAVPVQDQTIDFTFTALAPPDHGSVGLYVFDTRLVEASLTPPIAARAEYLQAVTTRPSSGVLQGLFTAGAHVDVPRPMAQTKFSLFGATLANPTSAPISINELNIVDLGGSQLFKDVLGVVPESGWTLLNENQVRWAGSLSVKAHSAADFLCEIQGNNKDTGDTPVPLTVYFTDDVGGTYINTNGATVQRGGSRPGVSLYYLEGGAPSLYLAGTSGGQTRSFQVAVAETQGVHIVEGTELRITIPAGWSDVAAADGQPGFDTPVILQPTATDDGLIQVTTTNKIKDASAMFSFSARAPAGVLTSLYRFTTRLIKADNTLVDTLAEAVVQVTDLAAGMEVRHLSPRVTTPAGVNQIDVQLVGMAEPAQGLRFELRNETSESWVLLETASFDATDQSLIGTVSTSPPDYFDQEGRLQARLLTDGLTNHKLGENLLSFVLSLYGMEPRSVAPPSTPQGRADLPLLAMFFSVGEGVVELGTMTLTLVGSDPLTDVARVRLIDDLDCDGLPAQAEPDLWTPQPPAPDGTVSFGGPLFSFDDLIPRCVLVAADVSLGATIGNTIGVQIADGYELTSDVGPYPFPSDPTYPVTSSDVLITEQDTDLDGIPDADELTLGSEVMDADTDDDGLLDGDEVGPDLVWDPARETNPLEADSDGDGLPDGLESGVPAFGSLTDSDGDFTPDEADPAPLDPLILGTDSRLFAPDLDETTQTDPLDDDSDEDGLLDGTEDIDANGRVDGSLALGGLPGAGETDPANPDSDSDGLQDGTELGLVAPQGAHTDPVSFRPDLDPLSNTLPLDDDSDDDGLLDGTEDGNADGLVVHAIGTTGSAGSGEPDPTSADTDGDGCQDGTELGLTAPQGIGTDPDTMIADALPATVTSPLDTDSDDDGSLDGSEDANCDGAVGPGERNPSVAITLLRNDEVTDLGTALATIFTGGPLDTLELAGPDLSPDPGEGPLPAVPGSADDDDAYVEEPALPFVDPDPVLDDTSRPLVFYQMTRNGSGLRLTKEPDARHLRLTF